ncbi:uncharacterized protein [Henckelia pumila]|uniref:uncharacterized protein n=1 Tax=Henckelia pumila TaxID=405737 RepID=UPI003C6DDCF4
MEANTFLLEGRAHKWWRSASAQLIHDQGHALWAFFCCLFRQLHFPPALRQAKEIEHFNLKQGTMSIDEYQQKFIDLLPYCPHIGTSSEAKYDHFLHGLNQDIFDRVTVCDDPTLYEGLYFKNQGDTSSSSSGSGGVDRFGVQRMSFCGKCRRRHPPGQCNRDSGACFLCGEMRHLRRDCHNLVGAASVSGSGSGSQATLQQQQSRQQSQQHLQK